MGQTLTHGVYLPDEGERNCYSGLAANWQLLDGAVGTIAEHTSALSGKAPLVHTHTKSDITDFPAYGNAAGTICEGNDSRLSDARTPVAHTHVTADVTDLLNSNHTWSGENTFTKPCKTLGKKLLTDITDLDDAYYNGEVCKFDPNTLHNPTGAYGNVLTINNAVNVPDNVYNSWITQIATAPDGSYLGFRNRSNGNAWTSWTSILTESRARPTVTNTYDLGSSSYQWNNLYANKVNTQSVNGINPGALSLPIFGTTYRQALDTTDWVLDGSVANTFTPSISGWLNIRISDLSGNYVIIQSGAITVSNHGTGTIPSSILTRALAILFPVEAGESVSIRLNTTSVAGFIYPCQGNV